MKRILIASMALLLASCEVAPTVIDKPDGSTTATMGWVFAARRKNTVAYIKTRNGNIIKFGSEEESGEDVPNSLIAAGASTKALGFTAHSADLKTVTDSKTTLGLGAQSVDKVKIKSAEKVTLGTFVPPKE